MTELKERHIEPPSPLRDCFKHCENRCASGCCGLDAFSTEEDVITEWIFKAGPTVAAEARWQIGEFMDACTDETVIVVSRVLNARTCDEAARARLAKFLGAFHRTLNEFA